ncbi:MAG TPA: PKD domain-containing protein [Saprospiraceae bacterium]|nr:PKD domain-containing protein [Saprospiraceae bacterium]HNT21820.1 PKD domain-containing protein [Saprospiraceae bacterium]
MRAVAAVWIAWSFYCTSFSQVTVDFTADLTAGCEGLEVRFTNRSTGPVASLRWDLGGQESAEPEPVRQFLVKGKYKICLWVTDSTGLVDSVCKPDYITILESPEIQYEKEDFPQACAPLPVNYLVRHQGLVSLSVDFGDGNTESLDIAEPEVPVKHTFLSGGHFFPVLRATDSFGCSSTIPIDTIVLHEVSPVLDFNSQVLCGSPAELSITDRSISTDPISAVIFRVTHANLSVQYDSIPKSLQLLEAGSYSVFLKIHSGFCADSVSYPDAVRLFFKPAAAYRVSETLFCRGDTMTFTDDSRSFEVIRSLEWMIGDQSYSGPVLHVPLHQGSLTVSLVATTEPGCRDTAVMTFQVMESVSASLPKLLRACEGSPVSLQASLPQPVEGMGFSWKYGDQTLCEYCLQYTVRMDTSRSYTFEARHPNGCLTTYDQYIDVLPNPLPDPGLQADTIICRGEVVPLSAVFLEDLFSYQWDPSRPGLSCYDHCRNPIAKPDSTTTFVLQLRNAVGCIREDSVRVIVNSPKGIDLGPDRIICPGDSYPFDVREVSNHRWSGSSGLSCTNCPDPVARPLNSSTYILSALEDGCPVTDTIRIGLLSVELLQGGKDTVLCSGSPVRLDASRYPTARWLPSDVLDEPDSPSPVARPISATTFFVKYTEDLCTIRDSFSVLVLLSTEITGRDRTVCPGEEFSLTAEGEATRYQWTGPNISSGQNTNSIRARVREAASFQVIAQNHTCSPDTLRLMVDVIPFISLPAQVSVSAIKDLPFQLNKTLVLDSHYLFQWTPASGLSCRDCTRPILLPDSPRTYRFLITDPATGCMLEQTVYIQLVESCQASDFFSMPNLFTPNQDGVNDLLFVIPKAADQIRSFRIFDRTGDLVFETFDLRVGWDGRLKQKEMGNGVYVYLVEAECPQLNQTILLSGDITLIR